MRLTTLTQSGAPGRVIGWTNFSHHHYFVEILNIVLDLSTIYFSHFGGC